MILSDLQLRPFPLVLAHLPYIPCRKALSVFPPPRNRPRLGVPSGSLRRQAGHSPPSPFRTSVRPSGIFPLFVLSLLSPFGSLFPFRKGVPRADSPRRERPLGSLQSSIVLPTEPACGFLPLYKGHLLLHHTEERVITVTFQDGRLVGRHWDYNIDVARRK